MTCFITRLKLNLLRFCKFQKSRRAVLSSPSTHLEVLWLLVVEDVALPVVCGGRPRRLVPEVRAALDGQRLVGVHERLADRQGLPGGT